jgi:cold shock protein
MATGTIKWFSDDKGFGFITPDDQGKDPARYTQPTLVAWLSLSESSSVQAGTEWRRDCPCCVSAAVSAGLNCGFLSDRF